MTKLVRSLRYEDNTAFNHTLWDRYDLLGLLSLSRSLDERDRNQREQYEYSYVQDGFYALLDRDTVYVPGGDEFIEKWEWVTSTPQFRDIQNVFNRDDIGRMVATEHLAKLMENLTKPEEDEQEQPGESNQQGDEHDKEEENDSDGQENTQDEQGQAEDEGQGQDDSDQEQTEGDNGQETTDKSQAKGESSEPTPGQIGPKQQTVLTPSLIDLEQTAQDVEDVSQTLNGLLPYVGDESFPTQIVKAQLLADRFNLKEFAKYLGFAKRAVKGAHRMSDASTGEFTGYRNTEWSDRLHPVDLIGVATKSLTTLVRISEGTLRERVFEENRARGRGPVILCRDESGSMGGYEHQKAQELELALANAFNSDKRDLVSIAWDHIHTRIHTYGDGDATEHLSQFLNGGTELDHVLEKAIEVAGDYVNGADILVITDGSIPNTDYSPLLEEYRKKNGRVWVIVLGNRTHDASQWADAVLTLDEIETSDKLSDIISQMNTKRAKEGEKRRVF